MIGRLILYEKPRIKNDLILKLKEYPSNTFGYIFYLIYFYHLYSKAYFNFLSHNNFKPE
jgi:hypothetical protein